VLVAELKQQETTASSAQLQQTVADEDAWRQLAEMLAETADPVAVAHDSVAVMLQQVVQQHQVKEATVEPLMRQVQAFISAVAVAVKVQ
jgi:hypothetical protein